MKPDHHLSEFSPVYKGPSQPVGRASPRIWDFFLRIVKTNITRQDGQATAQPLKQPAADQLGEIRVPTLILLGEYDTTSTLAMADKLEKDIPDAYKVIYPPTAHMLPLEQPQRFIEVVLNFLEKDVYHNSLPSPLP